MAELSTIARPYARAVFEMAEAGHRLGPWADELSLLSRAVTDTELGTLPGNPAFTREDLAGLFTSALGDGLSVEGRSLVRMLAENDRLAAAPEISRQYAELKAAAEARSDVEITTATEVTAAEKDTLTQAVARRLGRTPEIQWTVRPELIAGALIRSGDTVIDGSFAAGLEGMRLALTR